MRTALVILMLAFVSAPLSACPMCKDSTVAAAKTPVAQSSGLDFNKSIFFMLGGFATVVGFTGCVMYKATKLRV